jgi:hypothetical protein
MLPSGYRDGAYDKVLTSVLISEKGTISGETRVVSTQVFPGL